MTYLGMQIMVEGLALAAFGFMHQMTTEPLLKQLLRYVMSDESRHVAFGVLSLQEYYDQLSAAEIRERQEFAFEAAVRMRDRFLQQEVWDRMGANPKEIVPLLLQVPERQTFQTLLFAKIVPNCKKLGLLDAADGWLRQKFTELGVIAFEDWADTGRGVRGAPGHGDRSGRLTAVLGAGSAARPSPENHDPVGSPLVFGRGIDPGSWPFRRRRDRHGHPF